MDLIWLGDIYERADLVELRKAPVGLRRQSRAVRRESAPGNKNKCRTDLHAYLIGELEPYVQLSVKVLHHRHSLPIFNIESSISGALPSQSLKQTLSFGVVRTIWSGDFDALKEFWRRRRSRSNLEPFHSPKLFTIEVLRSPCPQHPGDTGCGMARRRRGNAC
jgi:hypothetical protein